MTSYCLHKTTAARGSMTIPRGNMFDALVMNPNWPDGASDEDMVLAAFPCMN